MTTTKELQSKIDLLAKRRSFWRGMVSLIKAPQTAEMVNGLRSRIAAKRDEYAELYDKCDPNNPVAIARCQEGRLLCREILLEFDLDNCEKMLATLDKEIKTASEEIKTVSGSEYKTGFRDLI